MAVCGCVCVCVFVLRLGLTCVSRVEEAGHEGEGAGGGEVRQDMVLSLGPGGVPVAGDITLLLLAQSLHKVPLINQLRIQAR